MIYASALSVTKTATLNNVKISFDGKEPVIIQAYNIDGYNYIRARDITNGLDMKVEALTEGAVGIRIFPEQAAVSASDLEKLSAKTINVQVVEGELAYMNKRYPIQCFNYADRYYFKVPYLEPGTYICTEIDTGNTGFSLDPTPKTFEITTKPVILEFVNQKLGSILLKKMSSVDRSPIADIPFSISRMNGERLGESRTSEAGIINFNDLDPGTYVLQELENPGYEPDTEPRYIEVKLNQVTTYDWFNTPVSSLTIYKTDSKTSKPLKNVPFEIRQADGKLIEAELFTDDKGRIYAELPAGDYHIVELKPLTGYETNDTVYKVTIRLGKAEVLRVENTPLSGIRINKLCFASKTGIYNVEFRLFDFFTNKEVAGPFYSDNQGVVDILGIVPEGRYKILETREAPGYIRDTDYKTVEFKAGQVTEITWYNSPMMGQIHILKKSADDNELTGLPKGTPIAGSVFEVTHYKTGQVLDQFETGPNGVGISRPLPLGRVIVKEIKASPYYKMSDQILDVEIEFSNQILKFEFTNESANTGVGIKKVGPLETMPGQQVTYEFKTVQNQSTGPLTDFFFRDVIPAHAVTLDKIITGSFNQSLRYKIMFKTNKNDYRVMADNLSTTQNNVVDCSSASLGLYSDEYVTEVMFVFGVVKAGFCQVENPKILCTVKGNVTNISEFANKADIGGKYGIEWIIGNTTWLTKIYKTQTEKLPRTGY